MHGIVRRSHLDERIHRIRNQGWQQQAAANLRSILQGSEISTKTQGTGTGPLLIPMHAPGAWCQPRCSCALPGHRFTEANGVTDNPNILQMVMPFFFRGNFSDSHWPCRLIFWPWQWSELASISERRVYRLLSGSRDLPGSWWKAVACIPA